ncbi:hypothetical protein [Psychrobium sp. 1_MG-2023]|uniref:hypothetical protein n=1 Tax=Psychrobium sp. 1_MG-2023 TaxID=3062624 RepID=UPI000C323E69|nr:hypothetical protein [Psychrobium sp. 1_MG-2023]MDP2560378.1 hypothetical protein [Psychrobium sp. 1_MG-2023]PKF55488.1 hypothetical protein CW748_13415 [Alteromonadales bacterium alter-6D02]
MYDVVDIHEFLFEANEVGEWEGEEALAADNINRIYHKLYQVIDPNIDVNLFREMLEAIWPYWQYQPGLLELDDDLIEHFVTFLIEEFEVNSEE